MSTIPAESHTRLVSACMVFSTRKLSLRMYDYPTCKLSLRMYDFSIRAEHEEATNEACKH
jgi:hypothetical protein